MDIQPLLQAGDSSIAALFPMATVIVNELVIVAIAVVAVVAVALFWALWRRNARGGVAIFVAFAVALIVGVIFQVRTADIATARREHAENQMEALQREILELERRQAEHQQRATKREIDDRLPDDRAGRKLADSARTPTELSAAWLPEVDEQFEADIYPSAELASQALIRDWSGHFEQLLAKGAQKPKFVRLVCGLRDPEIDELRLLEAMDEKVQALFPEASTLVTTATELQDGDDLKDSEFLIKLSVARSVKRKRQSASNNGLERFEFSGILSAAFSGRDWQFTVSAPFIEKPWLTATSEFMSLRHGTTYLILRSSQLASSRDEASRDVLGNAANRLGHLIDPREDQGLPRAASLIMLEQLETGKYIADRFAQSLKRPYGHVYREALLIDIGNTNLLDMIQVTVNEVRQNSLTAQRQRARQSSGWIGIVVVIGALTALYLLLNWLTKGYYRGPLTIIALLTGSGAILTVAMFAGLLA